MAPEILRSQPYDEKVDIWSLGVLLYEIFQNKSPYKGKNQEEIYKKILKDKIVFEYKDKNYKKLVK